MAGGFDKRVVAGHMSATPPLRTTTAMHPDRSTMMVRPKLPSAAPSDVGRVVGSQNVAGSECKSGNVAGQCGRMLGGCERALFQDDGSVVWLPVLEDKSRTEKQDRCRQCSEDCGLVTPSRAADQRHRGTCFAAVQSEAI